MNEIAIREPKAELVAGNRVAPIVPRTVEEVARVATAVITAGLAPASYEGRTPEESRSKIIIGIMKGAEVGFPPITALSTIAIINGRPCIWGDGAVALVQKQGQMESFREWFEGTEGDDDWTAYCEIKRKGQAEPYKGKFSVQDAKRAHLWNNPKKRPWMEYPQRMLKMRARAWALRDGFADCLYGLSVAEEAQDIPQVPEKTDTAFLDDGPIDALPRPESDGNGAPVPSEGEEADAPAPPQSDDGEALEAGESEAEDADREPSPGERYAEQMFGVIDECRTLEDLDATVEGMKPHLKAFDQETVKRIDNRVAMKREEIVNKAGTLV